MLSAEITARLETTTTSAVVTANLDVLTASVVAHISGAVIAQHKNATPTFNLQNIMPDRELGFTHLSDVTVMPISVVYRDNVGAGQTVIIG